MSTNAYPRKTFLLVVFSVFTLYSLSLELLVAINLKSIKLESVNKDIPVSLDYSDLPSIAYSFNGYHGDYLSIPTSLAAVFHPRNVYYVLVDPSISSEVQTLQRLIVQAVLQEQLAGPSYCVDTACVESRIFVSAGEFSVTWAGISEPLAILDAVAKLLKVNDEWDFFVNLTPVDYPLASQNDISALLTGMRGFSFMGTHSAGIEHASGKFEDRWHAYFHDPSLLRKRNATGDRQKLINIPGHLPKKIVDSPFLRIFQSESFGIFDRSFCEHVVNSPLARRTIALLSNGFAASEQLFATILGNSKDYGYCPSALRANNKAGGPKFDMENSTHENVQNVVRDMANTGLFFARKFPGVCVQSDDHCQEAYTNEPFRAAVLARLVRGNVMSTNATTTNSSKHLHHPPLQQVWRAAAMAKIERLIPACRDDLVLASFNGSNTSCTAKNRGPCQPRPFLGFHD